MLSKVNHKSMYHAGYIVYYILYVLSLVGFQLVAPKYLEYFTAAVKVYISFLLMYKFNPFTKQSPVTMYDREIIFSASILLFLTTVVGDLLTKMNKNLADDTDIGVKFMKILR